TLVTATLRDGDMVEGVEAWTKQGRARVTAKLTIDASGDADVAAMAGRETFMGHDGEVQNPTMIFRLAGVDVERFRARFGPDSILGDDVSQMIRNLHVDEGIFAPLQAVAEEARVFADLPRRAICGPRPRHR